MTEVGQAQARTAHNAWQKQITKDIPFPEMFYVSPLNRCLETAFITFNGLDKDIVRPFRPIVKEVRDYSGPFSSLQRGKGKKKGCLGFYLALRDFYAK